MTIRKHVQTTTIAAALLLVVVLPAPASAQLASRPAEDWLKTLEAPNRLAGLKTDEVVAAVGVKAGDVVADLGAGGGAFSLPFARAVAPGGKVYAVDLDQGFLTHIAEKARADTLTNVVPVLGKFSDPALPARDVDVAFFHDVLHHVENRGEYLKNVVRYLEPGGRVVIIDFHADQSPHRNEPQLVVSKEQATQWMGDTGFSLTREAQVFTDKYFLVFTRR